MLVAQQHETFRKLPARALALALVLGACGDDSSPEAGDAAAEDAAARDAQAGDGVRESDGGGVPWTGWHGGDGDCIDVGEPLRTPYCEGDCGENLVLRWHAGRWLTVEPSPPPGDRGLQLAVFGEDDIWVSNGIDVRRWTGDEWDHVIDSAGSLESPAYGEAWLTSTDWNGRGFDWSGERFDGAEFQPVEYPAGTLAQHAFGGAMWVTLRSGALARHDEGDWQYALGDADDFMLRGLSGVAGVGDVLWGTTQDIDGTTLWRRGASGFEPSHAERGTYRLYVRADDDVWAYGERDGTARVLHWDGASWKTVSPPPPGKPLDMWSDGSIVLGLSAWSVRSYASPEWDVVFEWPPSITASAMYVAGRDDIWVIGGRVMLPGSGASGPWIAHWDGGELQEIAAPDGVEWVQSIAGTGPDDVWIGTNFGPMRWDGDAWLPMTPDVQKPFERLLPAGEGKLLICFHDRILLWTGSDVQDVAIDPRWCPLYAASPTDLWTTYLPIAGREPHYYGLWHAQLVGQ